MFHLVAVPVVFPNSRARVTNFTGSVKKHEAFDPDGAERPRTGLVEPVCANSFSPAFLDTSTKFLRQ